MFLKLHDENQYKFFDLLNYLNQEESLKLLITKKKHILELNSLKKKNLNHLMIELFNNSYHNLKHEINLKFQNLDLFLKLMDLHLLKL